MRIIAFLLAFFCITHIYSQVRDDFSDGDFTRNPAWTGDVAKFKVDSKGRLRLDDAGQAGEAWLSTPSGFPAAISLSGAIMRRYALGT